MQELPRKSVAGRCAMQQVGRSEGPVSVGRAGELAACARFPDAELHVLASQRQPRVVARGKRGDAHEEAFGVGQVHAAQASSLGAALRRPGGVALECDQRTALRYFPVQRCLAHGADACMRNDDRGLLR